MTERHSDFLKLEIRKRKILEVLKSEEDAIAKMESVLNQRLNRLQVEETILMNLLESNLNSNPVLKEMDFSSSLLEGYYYRTYQEGSTGLSLDSAGNDSQLPSTSNQEGEMAEDQSPAEDKSDTDSNSKSDEQEQADELGLMDIIDGF